MCRTNAAPSTLSDVAFAYRPTFPRRVTKWGSLRAPARTFEHHGRASSLLDTCEDELPPLGRRCKSETGKHVRLRVPNKIPGSEEKRADRCEPGQPFPFGIGPGPPVDRRIALPIRS